MKISRLFAAPRHECFFRDSCCQPQTINSHYSRKKLLPTRPRECICTTNFRANPFFAQQGTCGASLSLSLFLFCMSFSHYVSLHRCFCISLILTAALLYRSSECLLYPLVANLFIATRDPGFTRRSAIRYLGSTGHKNRGNDFAAVTILCMQECIHGLRSTCITRATSLASYAARDSRGQQISLFANARMLPGVKNDVNNLFN